MRTNSRLGKLILFGSGETSETGKAIHRKILSAIGEKQSVAILETPAGFQPNSYQVAKDIKDIFDTTLTEFVKNSTIIPARKKGSLFSPDDPAIANQAENYSYFFLGPGSPTYAFRQLKDSLVWKKILEKWKKGASICLSSAGALASGKYTLPVYEIYKAGAELHWEKGLDIFKETGISLTIVTHWNNREGGKELDTRFCYMGEERFQHLKNLLPRDSTILGIDEHTAVLFDFERKTFSVIGIGNAYAIQDTKVVTFDPGKYYELRSIRKLRKYLASSPKRKKLSTKIKSARKTIPINQLPWQLQSLLKTRDGLKNKKEYKKADAIRNKLELEGYELRDSERGQNVYKK